MMFSWTAVLFSMLDPGSATVLPTAPSLADECTYPANWAPPFTHVYKLRNGATLVFVATQHTRDPADATHRMIRDAFDRYRPGFVLVEAVASSKSATEQYQTFLTNAAAHDFEHGSIQETLYAVKLAKDRGVAFAGWDFSPDEKYAGDVAKGFALTDALGAHLVWDKVDPANTLAGARAMEREASYAARVQPLAAFDYPGWYRAHYGAAFDSVHATPCSDGIAAEVFKDETRRRNLNLVGQIDRYATPNITVLVEAGANHWLALQPYLQSISKSRD